MTSAWFGASTVRLASKSLWYPDATMACEVGLVMASLASSFPPNARWVPLASVSADRKNTSPARPLVGVFVPVEKRTTYCNRSACWGGGPLAPDVLYVARSACICATDTSDSCMVATTSEPTSCTLVTRASSDGRFGEPALFGQVASPAGSDRRSSWIGTSTGVVPSNGGPVTCLAKWMKGDSRGVFGSLGVWSALLLSLNVTPTRPSLSIPTSRRSSSERSFSGTVRVQPVPLVQTLPVWTMRWSTIPVRAVIV